MIKILRKMGLKAIHNHKQSGRQNSLIAVHVVMSMTFKQIWHRRHLAQCHTNILTDRFSYKEPDFSSTVYMYHWVTSHRENWIYLESITYISFSHLWPPHQFATLSFSHRWFLTSILRHIVVWQHITFIQNIYKCTNILYVLSNGERSNLLIQKQKIRFHRALN